MAGKSSPKVFAHRGGRVWAPENTLSAFRKALELGVDGIELDIHRCKTGELFVIHDETVNRTTNGVGFVKDISHDELKRLSAGLWYDKAFADERLPTLQEVFDLVQGKAVINVEIKNCPVDYPGIEEDLLALLETFPYKDHIIVSSFDHHVLKRMNKIAPDVQIGLLAAANMLDIGEYAAKIGAHCYHPALDCLLKEGVTEAHQAKLSVNAWTCNSKQDWDFALDFGVDGIITDDPPGLKKYLAQKAGTTNAAF